MIESYLVSILHDPVVFPCRANNDAKDAILCDMACYPCHPSHHLSISDERESYISWEQIIGGVTLIKARLPASSWLRNRDAVLSDNRIRQGQLLTKKPLRQGLVFDLLNALA